MPNGKKKDFVIVVDTREQTPYDFPKGYETIRKKLDVGDYSIEGYEDVFSIERKSFDDWISSITRGRERFEKELVRGKGLEYFALVLEWDMKNVWNRHSFSRMSRKAVQNTAIFWSVKYGYPVFFASDRTHGKIIVRELCNAWMKYQAWEETNTLSLNPDSEVISDFSLEHVSLNYPGVIGIGGHITYDEPPEVDE